MMIAGLLVVIGAVALGFAWHCKKQGQPSPELRIIGGGLIALGVLVALIAPR